MNDTLIRFSKRYLRTILTISTILFALLTNILILNPLGNNLDRYLIDKWFTLNISQPPTVDDIVIIGIDDASIKQLGRWPWSRGIHADLINKLIKANAQVIVFDILFDAKADSEGDAKFSKALSKYHDIIISTARSIERHEAGIGITTWLDPLANFEAEIGVAEFYPHIDKVVRELPLRFEDRRFSLSYVAAKKYKGSSVELPQTPIMINYLGPPGTIDMVSYYRALDSELAPANLFRDKIVFIGLTTSIINEPGMPRQYDRHFVPLSNADGRQSMTGVEIFANATHNLIHKNYFSKIPREFLRLISIPLALIALLLAFKKTPYYPSYVLLVIPVSFLLSFIFFKYNIWASSFQFLLPFSAACLPSFIYYFMKNINNKIAFKKEISDWSSSNSFQFEVLHKALLSAYPSPQCLDKFLQLKFGKSYELLAHGRDNHYAALIHILEQAKNGGWLTELVKQALQDKPNNSNLNIVERTFGLTATEIPPNINRSLEDIVRSGTDFDDLIPWTEKLGNFAQQICRIEYPVNQAQGTGWLVAPDMIMTNWHVISRALNNGEWDYSQLVCRFDYVSTSHGTQEGTIVRLAENWCPAWSPASPSELGGTEEPSKDTLDYALLRLANPVGNEKISRYGNNQRGWVKVCKEQALPNSRDIVFVIQHPKGEPVKLTIGEVTGASANDLRILHDANTLSGSSGSAMVNASLELVALHHAGDTLYHKHKLGKPKQNQAIPIGAIVRHIENQNISKFWL